MNDVSQLLTALARLVRRCNPAIASGRRYPRVCEIPADLENATTADVAAAQRAGRVREHAIDRLVELIVLVTNGMTLARDAQPRARALVALIPHADLAGTITALRVITEACRNADAGLDERAVVWPLLNWLLVNAPSWAPEIAA